MDPKLLALGMLWYIVFLFSTTCHEAAHAWAAMKGGDRTAMLAGQVTLNPAPHMKREPFGTILVPILSFLFTGFMIGWASAPYDPYWQARYPKRAAWMALAGPIANIVIALVAGIILSIGLNNGLFLPSGSGMYPVVAAEAAGLDAIVQVLNITFLLNILLAVFNLLPVPPLDGSTAIGLVLSERSYAAFQRFISAPGASFMGLLIGWMLFGKIFSPIYALCVEILLH